MLCAIPFAVDYLPVYQRLFICFQCLLWLTSCIKRNSLPPPFYFSLRFLILKYSMSYLPSDALTSRHTNNKATPSSNPSLKPLTINNNNALESLNLPSQHISRYRQKGAIVIFTLVQKSSPSFKQIQSCSILPLWPDQQKYLPCLQNKLCNV